MFRVVIPTLRKNTEAFDNLWKTIPEETKNLSIIVYQDEPHEMILVGVTGTIEVYLKQNLFEYGAWIAAKKLVSETTLIIESDWLVMIHDTCAFQSDTLERIKNMIYTLNFTPINFYSLVHSGFHNLSLVRNAGIHLVADHFLNIKTITKEEAIAYEGDGIFKLLDGKTFRGEHTKGPVFRGKIWFDSGERSVVNVVSINLLKFYKEIPHNNLNEDVAVHRP